MIRVEWDTDKTIPILCRVVSRHYKQHTVLSIIKVSRIHDPSLKTAWVPTQLDNASYKIFIVCMTIEYCLFSDIGLCSSCKTLFWVASNCCTCTASIDSAARLSINVVFVVVGESQQLGPALSAVYTKANSVVSFEIPAPSWLHRFIIGKQGANIKKVSRSFRYFSCLVTIVWTSQIEDVHSAA